MLKGLLLLSGIAPSAALRPTTENILDLDVEFSLAETLKEAPGMPEKLMSNMRGVIEENLLKGSPDLSVQLSAHDPELHEQVASMLQQAQASSLEDKFAEQFELEKNPSENTQVLLEMGKSMKKMLNRPQLAETISRQISEVQQFIGEHPEINTEIKSYMEHARPRQHSGAQALPPSLMEELPVLAKKILPMFKPTVLGLGQSNLSLLQSSSNVSEGTGNFYTRFETAISMTFQLPCAGTDACFKIPVSLVMVKLRNKESDFVADPGFIILVPGFGVTSAAFNIALAPFIPIPAAGTGFLPAQKTGFALTLGWKEENITTLSAATKGPPTMQISAGCSYLPISYESKKTLDDVWGGRFAGWGFRTEPMLEVAGSYDFAASKWSMATAFKSRSAVNKGKDQYFLIFKVPLGSFKGDTVKGINWPLGITVGALYNI